MWSEYGIGHLYASKMIHHALFQVVVCLRRHEFRREGALTGTKRRRKRRDLQRRLLVDQRLQLNQGDFFVWLIASLCTFGHHHHYFSSLCWSPQLNAIVHMLCTSAKHSKTFWNNSHFHIHKMSKNPCSSVRPAPEGSVHGERANFTKLVLGCIEAKFCK